MTEHVWEELMHQLVQATAAEPALLCVGCWYQTHPTPFPAERSSCLCPTCATHTRKRRGVPQHSALVVPEPGGIRS